MSHKKTVVTALVLLVFLASFWIVWYAITGCIPVSRFEYEKGHTLVLSRAWDILFLPALILLLPIFAGWAKRSGPVGILGASYSLTALLVLTIAIFSGTAPALVIGVSSIAPPTILLGGVMAIIKVVAWIRQFQKFCHMLAFVA